MEIVKLRYGSISDFSQIKMAYSEIANEMGTLSR